MISASIFEGSTLSNSMLSLMTPGVQPKSSMSVRLTSPRCGSRNNARPHSLCSGRSEFNERPGSVFTPATSAGLKKRSLALSTSTRALSLSIVGTVIGPALASSMQENPVAAAAKPADIFSASRRLKLVMHPSPGRLTASARFPKFVLHRSQHFPRNSESYGHELVMQERQIGGASTGPASRRVNANGAAYDSCDIPPKATRTPEKIMSAPASTDAAAAPYGSVGEVFAAFLKLGVMSFGR